MTAPQKRERPKAVTAAKGPDIKLIHTNRIIDMNSVAQTKRDPSVLADAALDIQKLAILARQGDAFCKCLMLDETRTTLDPDQMFMAIWDLSDKFDRIAEKLEDIWNQ